MLRGAQDYSSAKKKSFQVIVECVRKRPRQEAHSKRQAIPYRTAHHTTSAALDDSGTRKRD